ncbi:putative transcriptional regulator SLK2 [Zea mays]|uniref:Putative transcriptional regulator SLK2 n=1 Tax=Zea mays TaxID=4577 RepID=A0A1D6HT48_MAIZE|nr:putative transcriptional regulator SLK2 [Zea mays]
MKSISLAGFWHRRFVAASRQLAKNLEHHTLNEHGLSKRYVRCLQISEVVNNMKDLIEFTNRNNFGPIEGLKNYPKPNVSELPGQNPRETKQTTAAGGLPNDQNNTEAMGTKQETSARVDNGASVAGAVGNSAPQNAAALNGYQNLPRSSSANQSQLQQGASGAFKGPAATRNGMQMEASRSFCGPNQVQLARFQHPGSFQHPMPQHNNLQGLGLQNNHRGLGVSPQYQQHALNQLIQEVKNAKRHTLPQQPPLDIPNISSGITSGGANTNSAGTGDQGQRMAVNGAATIYTGPTSVINNSTARSNNFKSVSSNLAVAAAPAGGNAATLKAKPFHEFDDLEHLIANELVGSGLLNGNELAWNS